MPKPEIIEVLPRSGNLYKVNLHTHSTCSDGKFTPEQLKAFLSEILDGHVDRERIEAVTAPLGSKVRNAYKRGKLPFSLQEGR